MVLTKDELLSALRHEIRLVLHLASKVEAAMLEYRPTPKQRSLIELLQYFTLVGPIHLHATLKPAFDMDAWRNAWQTGEARAKTLDLDQVRAAIADLPRQFADMLAPCCDGDFRAEIEMFGRRASRGSMMVSLVLSHYTAYRMQLFLYLKSCGREELNTMNLWAGMDMPQ
jgi:hypothetical protein